MCKRAKVSLLIGQRSLVWLVALTYLTPLLILTPNVYPKGIENKFISLGSLDDYLREG